MTEHLIRGGGRNLGHPDHDISQLGSRTPIQVLTVWEVCMEKAITMQLLKQVQPIGMD